MPKRAEPGEMDQDLIDEFKKFGFGTGPRQLNQNLIDEFTNFGESEYINYYRRNANLGEHVRSFSSDDVDSHIEKAKNKKTFHYPFTDKCLYKALDEYSIENKSVIIIGSCSCVYEAICLARNAKPTAIDYHKINNRHPDVNTITIEEYEKNPIQFDVAMSISTYEHTGLGRYGDPIDPNGDIKSMQELKNMIVKNGLLFLAIPVGADVIVYNEQRIYGRRRFERLIKDWKLLNSYGFNEDIFNKKPQKNGNPQPVFVLQNI